jgi:hypothetical protein
MTILRKINELCRKCGAAPNDDCKHSNTKRSEDKIQQDLDRINRWKQSQKNNI